MSINKYFIAKDNYTLLIEGDRCLDISIGNQFILLEDLHNETLRLKSIDTNMPDFNQIVLPCSILEDMSEPSLQKSNPIFRSRSTINDRISSMNLSDKLNTIKSSLKFNSIGHGKLPEGVSQSTYESKRSRTLPSTITINNYPETKSVLEPRRQIEECENDNISIGDHWKVVLEGGMKVYINVDSGDRWHAAMDNDGRQYYYSELSQQSSWTLPDSEPSREQSFFGDDPVSEEKIQGSDDDAYVEDEFDASSDSDQGPNKNVECRESTIIEISPDTQNRDSRFNIKHIRKEHISGPLFNKLMRTERSGAVEKTKVSENGKEIPRKWGNFHIVLTGPELLFYKDIKAVAMKPGSPQGKVELKLKIENLDIAEKKDPNSKILLLHIEDKGAPGSSIGYLLRYSSNDEMVSWKAAMQYAKNWQNENMYSENAFKIDPIPLDETPVDKQNIGIKLKQLLKKRPTRESLEARGILKLESVFGSSLDILSEQEKSKVPEFVFRCILAIEARGLEHNGIYRVSGNQAKIQRLRLAVDENKYQLNSEFIELETLTGALKSFFKELREPLFDEEFCTKMIEILSNRKPDKKNVYRDVSLSTVKKLVSKMKTSHYHTTKALISHLHRVAALSRKNLMDVSNLSMVWGPNLYLVTGQASAKLAVTLMIHNQIIDYLITFCPDLFDKC